MYLPLYQLGQQSAQTDNLIYPCPSLPLPSSPMIPYQNEPIVQTRELFETTPTPTTPAATLLPVLDCRFNLREICKQCILLEDHLSHDEKRCTDCCIKHFLALEGLCEEAITLDKTGQTMKTYLDLPTRIREIQALWNADPSGNAHQCAQMLREIRKRFQPDVFSVVFDSKCSNNSCSI